EQPARRCASAAAGARCGRGAVSPRTRRIQQSLAKLHRGFERVLESDFGKAAIAQCQARAWRPVSIADYVLTQPPAYTGPPKPQNPLKPEVQPPRIYVPVVADFVAAARQEFKFVPRFPQSETEFRRGYANVALAAGLTRDQIVRIYGFEATGNGSYDIEAGLEYNKHGRAITTALGYNQLLATNSVEILAEKGDEFIKQLESNSAVAPVAERQPRDGKIDVLRKM